MSKNPVEVFLEKKAGGVGDAFGRAAKALPGHFGSAAAGAAAAGAVGLAGAGIGAAVSGILNAATKGHDFRTMMENNEDLLEHHERDPKRFNLMFNTLRNMNPEFSKDPLVAGSFMRRMIESPTGIGGIAGEALKQRGDFPESAFGVAHDFAREGAKAGITQSLRGGHSGAPGEGEGGAGGGGDRGGPSSGGGGGEPKPHRPGMQQQLWKEKQEAKGQSRQKADPKDPQRTFGF